MELAQQLASQGHITNLETGNDAPSLRLILHAARLFNVSTDYLLRDAFPVEDVRAGVAESLIRRHCRGYLVPNFVGYVCSVISRKPRSPVNLALQSTHTLVI